MSNQLLDLRTVAPGTWYVATANIGAVKAGERFMVTIPNDFSGSSNPSRVMWGDCIEEWVEAWQPARVEE